VLVAFLGALGFVGYKFVLPWWNKQPPPPSGKELRVQVIDVGQGDAILIMAPEKVVLVDAGDERGGKRVVEVLKQNNVQQIDYFVATHTHPDHIGGAAEVFNNFKVLNVLHNDFAPPEAVAKKEEEAAASPAGKGKNNKQPAKPQPKARQGKVQELPTVRAYNSFVGAVENEKAEVPDAKFEKAEPERVIELGGGARLIVIAPIPPFFTKEQIASSRRGNESNANSIVMRLEYGDFSMLLTGDAEEQTEDRLIGKETSLAANVLKVGHHGSRYATSEGFLKRVFNEGQASKAAIISTSENNRYGHPNQDVLNRLKAAGVAQSQLYRTDLQGDITLTTTGKQKDGKLYEIKGARETKSDLWAGREGEKNDSSSSGFITYGDYGPPPRQRKK
jgi:competence protein ComEC